MSLHRQVDKLDSVRGAATGLSDNVLTAGNRLAMHEFGLSAAGLCFTLPRFSDADASRSASATMTTPQGRYHYRLQAPHPAAGWRQHPPAISRTGRRRKLLRLLSAGIALCIEGETGSGKVCQLRCTGTAAGAAVVVAINCAAIPESLIESELFVPAEGVYRRQQKWLYIGKSQADGGVLFLMNRRLPLALQARLLRVLQEGRSAEPAAACRWYFALESAPPHRNLTQRVGAENSRERSAVAPAIRPGAASAAR